MVAGNSTVYSRVIFPTTIVLLTLATHAVAQTSDTLIDIAQNAFRMSVVIELAGLFWIACEIVILFCMGVATRNLLMQPIPEKLSLTETDKRIAYAWIILFVSLSMAVLLRHVFVVPLPDALATIQGSGEGSMGLEIRSAYIIRARTHLFIWCLFITGWVALEIAIVVKGVSAYRTLRHLFHEREGA